jgi:iron complex transport system substrate-binding protein
LAGGCNPWGNQGSASVEITTAQAQAAAPELIIMSWCGVTSDKYRPHIVHRREGWERIPAVRNRQIHPISEAWLGRPGPRLVEGLRHLRARIEALDHS